ncbi:MAG: VanZ family protein [Pseudomonadota bacterium]
MNGLSWAKSARFLTASLALAIAILSLTPDTNSVGQGLWLFSYLAQVLLGSAEQSDKIGHFAAYGALGFVAALGFEKNRRLLTVFLVIVLYGVILEGVQGLSPVRSTSWADMLANSLGAMMGLGLAATGMRALQR